MLLVEISLISYFQPAYCENLAHNDYCEDNFKNDWRNCWDPQFKRRCAKTCYGCVGKQNNPINRNKRQDGVMKYTNMKNTYA